MRIPIILLIIFFTNPNAFSQFLGRVIDSESEEPLAFASISIEDKNKAVITDETGHFKITDQTSEFLEIKVSYIGYTDLETTIFPEKFIILELAPGDNLIGEVSVSATYFQSALKSVAGSIHLIEPAIIEQHRNIIFKEMIDRSPGVFMASGTNSTNRLIIRGIGSRNPYGTNRIRMYLDEIPITLADGSSSPDLINPMIIDRIEVIKGPSSALYGAGLGGTILIKSEYPDIQGVSVGLNSEYGAWNSFYNNAAVTYKKENTAVSLSGRTIRSDGYRENNNYDRNELFWRFERRGEKLNLKMLISYNDFLAGIPSSLNENDYNDNPRKAADSWKNVKGFEDTQNLTAGLNFSFSLTENLVSETTLFSNYFDLYESRPFNIYDSRQTGLGVRQNFKFGFFGVNFITGFEGILEHSSWETFQTISGNKGDKINALDEERSNITGYFQAKVKIFPRLRLESGISVSVINYNLKDRFIKSEDLSGNYRYRPEFSPRIGINYRAGKNNFLYFSAGHGFSPPGLEETLLPSGEANTEIKPERGWTFDGGFRGNALNDRLYYDIGSYIITLKDLLVIKRLSPDQFMNVNAGKTRHTGLELFMRYLLKDELFLPGYSLFYSTSVSVSANSFLEFIDDETDFSGKKLPGIPQFMTRQSLEFSRKENLNLVIMYNFTGKQFMNDDNTRDYPGHHLIHLKAGYSMDLWGENAKLRIFLKANNLFNKHYASMILVNAPSFGGSAPRYYYPGEPRNFRVGMELKL